MNNEVEQVLKEFEELGYKVLRNDDSIIALHNSSNSKTIAINLIIKILECYEEHIDDNSLCWGSKAITFQEHQLLTKLFKAMRWYDE